MGIYYFIDLMEVLSSASGPSRAGDRTMSNSSTCSMDSTTKKTSLAKISKAMAASANTSSTRSSVSSMTSMSSVCSTSLPSGSQPQYPNNNLNHALAVVTNQLEREQRKHDQEDTRKLTLLRQRKISAVLKVCNCLVKFAKNKTEKLFS